MSRETDCLSKPKVEEHPETSPQIQPSGFLGAMARFFKFEENQTTFRQEVLAGVTTFMAMAYILAVNPTILSNAIFLEQLVDFKT